MILLEIRTIMLSEWVAGKNGSTSLPIIIFFIAKVQVGT